MGFSRRKYITSVVDLLWVTSYRPFIFICSAFGQMNKLVLEPIAMMKNFEFLRKIAVQIYM